MHIQEFFFLILHLNLQDFQIFIFLYREVDFLVFWMKKQLASLECQSDGMLDGCASKQLAGVMISWMQRNVICQMIFVWRSRQLAASFSRFKTMFDIINMPNSNAHWEKKLYANRWQMTWWVWNCSMTWNFFLLFWRWVFV